MTKIDRMFASLIVELVRSLTKETDLSTIRMFVAELVPQRSAKQTGEFIPIFRDVDISQLNLRDLMLLLNEYWSFFNCSLLEKLIKKFGSQEAKADLKLYVTYLQELLLSEIPVLLHHRPTVKGFSLDTLIVTTKPIFSSLTVDDLLQVRDSIARILRIERFALLLRRIKKDENQLEFLVAETGKENLLLFNQLELSSLNEAYIFSISFQGVERKQTTGVTESDDDEGIN